MRGGVYPGTFDPVTLGHMDIIRRSAKLVDRLVIGVTTNVSKSPMFSLDERVALAASLFKMQDVPVMQQIEDAMTEHHPLTRRLHIGDSLGELV